MKLYEVTDISQALDKLDRQVIMDLSKIVTDFKLKDGDMVGHINLEGIGKPFRVRVEQIITGSKLQGYIRVSLDDPWTGSLIWMDKSAERKAIDSALLKYKPLTNADAAQAIWVIDHQP